MSGTTAHGWPYVTPDDHPKEFPAASQALAQQLEARLGAAKVCGGQAGITNGQAAITFPAGMYVNTPPTVALGVTPAGNQFASVGNITTTGATIYLTEKDGVTPAPGGFVGWIALGYS